MINAFLDRSCVKELIIRLYSRIAVVVTIEIFNALIFLTGAKHSLGFVLQNVICLKYLFIMYSYF
jgi:hypothetical protein